MTDDISAVPRLLVPVPKKGPRIVTLQRALLLLGRIDVTWEPVVDD